MNIAKSSKKLYENNYKRVSEHVNPTKLKELMNWLETSGKKKATQLSYLSSVIHVLRDSFGMDVSEYEKEFKRLKNDFNDEYKYSPAKEGALTWQELIEAREYWKGQAAAFPEVQKTRFNYLLLSTLTMVPPLRGGEFINMIYKTIENKRTIDETLGAWGYNVCDLDNKMFYIKFHKTANRYGTKHIAIPEKLFNVVSDYQNDFDATYYFGYKFSSSALTKRINEIFGRKVSIDDIRKAYITEIANLPKETRKAIARVMGHSIETQETIYNKN